ncbi:MAG: peptide deformylase [Ignavibacteriales bacterium]|jgi:peptide deformylase|nr:peptide deformylase [Ignavibacteriaceae bacterium]NLH60750.1 peptide deformylase [Ignavibacteriales bacterium]HOJ17127.1 peptide deformylase [Ignavibacteriaceae bacterium]HPO56055.1 peptide deformylase [Ignavibacteriaceae bacterium]
MGIIPVNLYGDPVLEKKTKRITKVNDQLVKFIDSMFETMRNADGIGLAANQVGANISLFVIDVSPVDGYEKVKPIIMLNPRISESSEETVDIEEGCLSLPFIRSKVIRPKEIRIEYQDKDLVDRVMEAGDVVSRVIQHEYDHLNGIYFTDRLDPDMQKKIKRMLKKIKNRSLDFEYPVTDK